jgi:putative transposase
MPKRRQGTYSPACLEPRRRREQALVSVIPEAYVQGIRTRKVDQVDQWVLSLGMTGSRKSHGSARCRGLDEHVQRVKQRPGEHPDPSVWLDATSLPVRDGDRVMRRAVVAATGVDPSGDREVLGL